jgi:hypothetical protein
MYVIGTLTSKEIEGTRSEPDTGASSVTNGKFYVPVPEGVAVTVDTGSSLIVPNQAAAIPGEIASEFLVRFPMYDHVLWNFFLESTDMALLDVASGSPSPAAGNVLTGTPPSGVAGPNGARCQIGRGTGPAPVGIAPNSVAILSRNLQRAPATYGSLMTDTFDTTPFTGASGTDEIMLWWRIFDRSTSEDVLNGFNDTVDRNEPVMCEVDEIAQEPVDFLVYASADDGVTWHECRYLEPCDLVTPGTDLRIAFVNQSASRIYLMGFIAVFVNAP